MRVRFCYGKRFHKRGTDRTGCLRVSPCKRVGIGKDGERLQRRNGKQVNCWVVVIVNPGTDIVKSVRLVRRVVLDAGDVPLVRRWSVVMPLSWSFKRNRPVKTGIAANWPDGVSGVGRCVQIARTRAGDVKYVLDVERTDAVYLVRSVGTARDVASLIPLGEMENVRSVSNITRP